MLPQDPPGGLAWGPGELPLPREADSQMSSKLAFSVRMCVCVGGGEMKGGAPLPHDPPLGLSVALRVGA